MILGFRCSARSYGNRDAYLSEVYSHERPHYVAGAFLGEAQPVLVMVEGPACEQLHSAVAVLRAEDRPAFLADAGLAVRVAHRLCTQSPLPSVDLPAAVATARRCTTFPHFIGPPWACISPWAL